MRSFLLRTKNRFLELKRFLNFILVDKYLNFHNLSKIQRICRGNETLILILHGKKYKRRVCYLKEYYESFGFADFLFYSDYEDLKQHVLKVSFSNDYASNEAKHINILNLLIQSGVFEKYNSILCVDDDTFVNKTKLVELQTTQNEVAEPFWICGQILDQASNADNPIFHKWPQLRYFSGGAGYLINSSLFRLVREFTMHFTDFSDVSLGLNLMDYPNITFYDSEMFHSQNYDFYHMDKSAIEQNLTFHYVRDKDEFNFYKECSLGLAQSNTSLNLPNITSSNS